MSWRRAVWLLWWLPLCLCSLVTAPAMAGDDDPTAAPDDARRQVLVMLRLPPAHYRPDSAYTGGYDAEVGSAARRALAGELARRHGLSLVTHWPIAALGVDCFVMAVPPPGTASEMAETLAEDPRVAWAQAMNVYRGLGGAPGDALTPALPAAPPWRLAELHELATGRGVRVAVIDSAVDTRHPDLAGQIERTEDFVEGHPAVAERHGTAVAGIIAARADGRLGTSGVAPGARLLALRACWQAPDDASLCTSLGLARALLAALAQRADVINLSLGGPPDRLLAGLLDLAMRQGVVVIAAVDRSRADGGFPASHPGVIAVGGEPALHTLTAPGRDIPVPAPGAGWDIASGDSYAAAHVSGLVALLRELGAPGAPAWQRDAAGRIDACATLAQRMPTRRAACGTPSARFTAAHP